MKRSGKGKWKRTNPGRMPLVGIVIGLSIWVFLNGLLDYPMTGEALAFQGTLRTGVGYDDNATLEPDGCGSGFIIGRVNLFQELSDNPAVFNMDLYMDGFYQKYFRVQDRFLATGGISMSREAFEGLFVGGLFLEGSVFRDDLVPEDEYNGFSLGGYGNYLLTTQMEVTLRQVFSWNDFSQKVSILLPANPMPYQPGNGPGVGPGPNFPPGPPMPPAERLVDREDRSSLTELSTSLYLSPTFTTNLGVRHYRKRSSVKSEAYDSNGMFMLLKWVPDEKWSYSFSLAVSEADYKRGNLQQTRKDNIRSAAIEITRFIGKWEWFFRLDQSDIDSSLDSESYQRTVTQCGVILPF